jgi:hypothetical protein
MTKKRPARQEKSTAALQTFCKKTKRLHKNLEMFAILSGIAVMKTAKGRKDDGTGKNGFGSGTCRRAGGF